VPGTFIPHWICEVYDENTQTWGYIDPERGILNLDREDFSTGGKIWLAAREGRLDPKRVMPDYRDGLTASNIVS
jgi:hypothetical protein